MVRLLQQLLGRSWEVLGTVMASLWEVQEENLSLSDMHQAEL